MDKKRMIMATESLFAFFCKTLMSHVDSGKVASVRIETIMQKYTALLGPRALFASIPNPVRLKVAW